MADLDRQGRAGGERRGRREPHAGRRRGAARGSARGGRGEAAHARPRARADDRRRLRHQLRQGRPHSLLSDPRHEAGGGGRAGLHTGGSGQGRRAAGIDALEAPPSYRGDDVPDGDRRVLPATGGLLMQPKHPRDSETIMSELMMPQHANIMGNVFGGVVLSLVDRVAAVAAIRHASKPCVTVSVDKVDFKEPIHVGELLTAYARVNFAGRSSMEVGVKIIAENVLTGGRRHTNSCYVTYVALDEQGVPTQVPPIVPETADEKRRYDRASKRRATRVMDRRFNTGAGE